MARKIECELCYVIDPEKLHKKPTLCVANTDGFIYLCGHHNDTTAGYKEEIRCKCIQQPSYYTVYDPRACGGKPHDGPLIDPTGGVPSGFEYFVPPKCSTVPPKTTEGMPTDDELRALVGNLKGVYGTMNTDATKQKMCDRCSKMMSPGEIFARCSDCTDAYCSLRCTLQMGSVAIDKDGRVLSCICTICDDDCWPSDE